MTHLVRVPEIALGDSKHFLQGFSFSFCFPLLVELRNSTFPPHETVWQLTEDQVLLHSNNLSMERLATKSVIGYGLDDFGASWKHQVHHQMCVK